MTRAHEIELVVFDWAGTLCDHGSLAPVAAFREVFARRGVAITQAQARGPMGLAKRDHIAALLDMTEITTAWQEQHGRPPTDGDVDDLYTSFQDAQIAALQAHADLIDGACEVFDTLRARGVRVATTTGYFRAAADAVVQAARAQGLAPDHAVCADDVPAGRPAPFMLYRCMEALGVYPAERVMAVGDTAADMKAARNAGCLAVAVARTGNEVGLSEREWAEATPNEQALRLERARTALRRAGAHYVLNSVRELPVVIATLERRRADVVGPRKKGAAADPLLEAWPEPHTGFEGAVP